jgi:hypothetical protein
MAFGRLALEASVPKGCEVVRDVAHTIGGVDFPVLGGGRFGVRVVQETVFAVSARASLVLLEWWLGMW